MPDAPAPFDPAPFDPVPAAQALYEARQHRRPIGPLPGTIMPRNESEARDVQHALARLMAALPPAGFKIGATARRMQDYLGLAGPAAGFMPLCALHRSGVELAWADLRRPGIECEIGVRLARDLPPGPCDAVQAQRAVAEVFAAIEIVENRYGATGDFKSVGTPALIADQFFHRAAVLGEPLADWRGADLASLTGRIAVDGVERDHGIGADLLGHPMQALAWLAAAPLAARFGGLRAGQVIMLGSVTPPIWLDGPCEACVTFDTMAPVRLHFR